MAEIPASNSDLIREGVKYISRRPLYEITYRTGVPIAKPISATIVLTTRCNLDCPFCFLEKGEFESKLSDKKLLKLIDELTDWGVKQISFTGGEPFSEKPLLFKLMKHAKSKGAAVGVVTNGTLVSKKDVEAIRRMGVDRVSVSIDGSASVHDMLRGNGTYEKAVKTLERLSGISGKNGKTRLRINTIVLDSNVDELVHLFLLAKEFGASLVLSPFGKEYLTAVRERKIDVKTAGRLWVRKSRIAKLAKVIGELKTLKRKHGILLNPDSFLDMIPKYYDAPSRIPHKCRIATYHIGVARSGDVVLCGYSGALGNVRHDSLENIWKSKKFREARVRMRGCNRCLLACQYTPSALELLNGILSGSV